MADVIDMPSEAPDRGRNIQPDQRENTTAGSPSPPPPPPRKRGRDSKEERDDWPPGRQNDHRDSRDGSPPLSPPPPVPAPKDDKNREYRRRNSPSSPSYRDRRHSSPRRSPLHGPFKRARKDGGGYDRRRGSPRGGYGPDEKSFRYGYDYDRGYDRGGPGGRGWYGEERPQGRHDWPDSGHGSYGDDSETIQRGGLMSYKQFMQELEDDILPAEAERRYEEYRSEYISTQKRAYFEAHKEEKWLKDKYHPTNLVAVIERRKELAKSIAKDFLLDLQRGMLDVGPGLTATSARKSGNSSEPNSEEEADTSGKRRRHGRGPAKENDQLSAAPKAHPVSTEIRRIQIDILQAQDLVRKLDMEKGIQDNILSSSGRDDADKTHGGSLGPIVIIRGPTTVKGLEGVELLDTFITYLWRVHGLDYYGMSETSEAKGFRHVRADIKAHDGANSSGSEWEKKLDSFWQARLEGQDPLEILTAKDKIDAAATEALDPFVRKIRDEKYGWKYGCGAKGCTKLFHAPEFVHKHLKLKHPELVIELTSKVREDLYFQNYMNDPNAPGGTPIMQQSAPKARAQRWRLLDNRLRDAHGNRIELNRNRDDDRNNNSPSDNHGGLDGETYENPPYDAHRGQGLHGAFPSDIPPPPILVPVPGAGPLGPFVPAPPEVAMRMLTEPGRPSSFDTSGGPHGRKGRLGGPQLGGTAAPILAMPPPFLHDPRRMRSYRDLDAPDDEVTVLDYRSL